jgi:hypothetical protein
MDRKTSAPATVNILRPLSIIVLFIYPVLMIVQGIDFTDMGFNLSNQWFLLRDPGIYQHGYLFYLSNLLGGLWLSVAAPFGLFWVKFGWAVVLYLSMVMAYLTLKDVGSSKGLVLGLVVALLWIPKLGFNWMDYNWFTGLFFTTAAFLLHRGLVNNHRGFLVAGAAVLGASVLARFPNVLALGFVFVIPLFAYLEGRGWRWALRRSLTFVAGFVAGIGVVLLLMLALGHLDFYIDGLEQRFATSGEDARYMYSADSLLRRLFVDYARLASSTVLAVPLLAVVARALRWQWPARLAVALALALSTFWFYSHQGIVVPWWLLAVTGVLAFTCTYIRQNTAGVQEPMSSKLYLVVMVVLSTALGFAYALMHWVWLVPGLLLVFLVHQILYAATTSQRLVAGLALAALVITPLGSGNGMINAVFGMWLAIPMGFAVLLRRLEGSGEEAEGSASALLLTLVIAATLVGTGARIAYYSTYRDTFDRGRMTATVDHPLLRGVLTTPERAWVVEELLEAVGSRVRPGEPLLLHGGCSLVYLLTDTRPVLGSTWNGVYPVPKFRQRLDRFEQSDANSPIVLLSKGSCRDREWPLLRRMPDVEVATLKLLVQFMKRRDYELVWQNGFFEIWQAPGSVSHGAPAAKPRTTLAPRV